MRRVENKEQEVEKKCHVDGNQKESSEILPLNTKQNDHISLHLTYIFIFYVLSLPLYNIRIVILFRSQIHPDIFPNP